VRGARGRDRSAVGLGEGEGKGAWLDEGVEGGSHGSEEWWELGEEKGIEVRGG
jgi:hypothetical protein